VARAATRRGTGLAAACAGADEVNATGAGAGARRGGAAFAFALPPTATPCAGRLRYRLIVGVRGAEKLIISYCPGLVHCSDSLVHSFRP
jgi:hypothetical protein